jgi:putative aldouronate transport system substrate-binding protein
MKTIKCGVSSFLGLLFLTGFLSCGNKESQAVSGGGNFEEPPYEVNFMYLVAAEGPNQGKVQDAVNALALKELNMKVRMIPMTFGSFFSQISMMLAANEPLDLFPTFSNNFSTYIESQYVVNMADYLDYAQDAIRILGDDAFTGYIGDFLIGFGQMKERGYPAGLVARKDIFEELGYKVEDFSVTTDDYASFNQITELFAKVKQKYPSMVCLDGTSIMARQNLSYMDNLGSDFGVLENYGQTTTITNYFESEQYRRFCLLARDWFQKGYLSTDITVSTDSGELKMRAGNCFSFITNVKPNTDVEKLAQTGYDVVVIQLGQAMKNTNAVNSALFSIANASKNPAKAMQFLNWTYTSGDFNDLINWGIKGEDWIETPDGFAAYPAGVDATNVGYHNDYGFIYPNQFAGHPWVGNPSDIWEQYGRYNAGLLVSKAFGFTFDSTPVASEEAQLNTVLAEYQNDLSFGAVDIEQRLRGFNRDLYSAGLQRVIDEKQKQLDAWLSQK